MTTPFRRGARGLGAALALLGGAATRAWTAPPPLSTEADHALMMRAVGVDRLRPGPSGDEHAPDAANYDEARANPDPDWPDPLRFPDGRPVTTAQAWYAQRRPQIAQAFEREVYGRLPAHVPDARWRVTARADGRTRSGIAMRLEALSGRLSDAARPDLALDLHALLIKPSARASRPRPVLVMLSPPQFGWPLVRGAVPTAPAPSFGGGASPGASAIDQLVAAGWAVALLDPASVQADSGSGLTRGVIGLVNAGRPRSPEDWGALRAWAWGAGQVYRYVATDPELDPRRVGVEGVSRYGKAALVTMAFDPRFAMGLIGSSGEGGVKPYRRNFGESVENLTSTSEYHWMAGAFLRYGAASGPAGARSAADLPVDSPELIALCAPRLLFISSGVPARGDARWLDQRGGYMATVAAGKVYRLLGAGDLGVGDDYKTAQPPPVGTGLLSGALAWRQHEGGHTDVPNIGAFIAWSDQVMGRRSSAPTN